MEPGWNTLLSFELDFMKFMLFMKMWELWKTFPLSASVQKLLVIFDSQKLEDQKFHLLLIEN